MKLKTALLASMLSIGTLFAGTFNVDVDHTSVAFKIKHMMISNVTGNFDKFTGSFIYDEKSKTLQSFNGEADVNSINTKNEKRDGHLKSPDFFDVKKYPSMSLALTKVEGDKAYGNLTIHGVTKEIEMEVETSGLIQDPWGNTRMGLSLSGSMDRKDYGLTWNKVIEAGGVMVGDKVKINLEIEGILAK